VEKQVHTTNIVVKLSYPDRWTSALLDELQVP